MAKRKRPPLTQKREVWASQRGGGVFKGTPLHYNASASASYRRDLEGMISEMIRSYEYHLRATFNKHDDITTDASIASQARMALNALQERFAKMFADRSRTIVDRTVSRIDSHSVSSLHTSLEQATGGLSLKVDTLPAALKEALTSSTVENVSLIKTLPQQYHTQIEGAVMRSIQPGGNGMQDVYKALRKYDGMTKNRAKFIAEDQTRKITSAMNVERAQSAGMKQFMWNHSGGSAEPRPYHVRMDGKIYDYANPPVIDPKTGERGYPGQLINCKCFQTPVITF